MKLTADEIKLLRDLESRGGETTMSWNKRHADLDRIVEAGLCPGKLLEARPIP
jgi:hypothetical protein